MKLTYYWYIHCMYIYIPITYNYFELAYPNDNYGRNNSRLEEQTQSLTHARQNNVLLSNHTPTSTSVH